MKASFTQADSILTAEELAKALNLPSAETVKGLARSRKLPFIRLGYRTHRYSLNACLAALGKLTVKEI